MIYKFFDTSSLLINPEVGEDEALVISSITLQELEDIKTSAHKDIETKRAAARLIRSFESGSSGYEVYLYKPAMMDAVLAEGFAPSQDMQILATAIWYDRYVHPDATVFVTNDLALKNIANVFFGEDSIESVEPASADHYTGYRIITLKDDEEFGKFYSDLDYNHFNLIINEYLILKNAEGKVVDCLCWTGETHRRLSHDTFKSKYFGLVKPMKGDEYQRLAADSLEAHDVTMLCGKPGSGKTWLAFGYLFHLLERGTIDRIIVFCNPVVAKNAAKLGSIKG